MTNRQIRSNKYISFRRFVPRVGLRALPHWHFKTVSMHKQTMNKQHNKQTSWTNFKKQNKFCGLFAIGVKGFVSPRQMPAQHLPLAQREGLWPGMGQQLRWLVADVCGPSETCNVWKRKAQPCLTATADQHSICWASGYNKWWIKQVTGASNKDKCTEWNETIRDWHSTQPYVILLTLAYLHSKRHVCPTVWQHWWEMCHCCHLSMQRTKAKGKHFKKYFTCCGPRLCAGTATSCTVSFWTVTLHSMQGPEEQQKRVL